MGKPRERAERGGYASGGRTAAELPPPPASVIAPRSYTFTRDQLIDALTRLEAYPATVGPGHRVFLVAESMADALIEALGADS